MKTIKFLKFPLILSLFFVLISAKADDKETERIHSASNVLKEFSTMKESIPKELMSKYEGIVIIPKLINGGLLIGGKRGKGVAMVKLGNGKWSDPVFVTLTGGSVGFQVGLQSVDLILVIRHKSVLTDIEKGNFTIGGDISAAAGPVNRNKSATTDYKLEAEIYSYSRSRGLFAGISLNGSGLNIDNNADANFYGNDDTSKEIFAASKDDSDAVSGLKESLKAF
jgi:lipid-binding SYLF domain-containing protein